MTYRQYIVTLGLIAAVSAIGWLLVLIMINPQDMGLYGVVLFLGLLWLAVVSALALAWLVAGVREDPEAVLTRVAMLSFTRAIAAGTSAVALLITAQRWPFGSSRMWSLVFWLLISVAADRIIVKRAARPRGLPPTAPL